MVSKLSQLPVSFGKPIPRMPVTDMQASLNFYVDQLGFKLHGVEDDKRDVGFASVTLGDKCECNIYLYTEPTSSVARHPYQTMILINPKNGESDAIDSLASYYESKGVKLVEKVEDKPWGYRQFQVADPDGHLLEFFQHIKSE